MAVDGGWVIVEKMGPYFACPSGNSSLLKDTIHDSPQAVNNDSNSNQETGAKFDNDFFHANRLKRAKYVHPLITIEPGEIGQCRQLSHLTSNMPGW